MSTIVIKYDGTDITDDVVIAEAEFVARTDANLGEANFRVLDRKGGPYTKTYFKVGKEVTLDVDGKRVWGGYVQDTSYQYPGSAWDVTDHDATPRFFTLRCLDYNVLFFKRVLWNKAKPVHQMKVYKASDNLDSDKQIIKDFVNLYLDLSGDGFEPGSSNAIDMSNVVELGEIYWKENCATTWQAASPGMQWGDGMKHIAAWSGAVFYIGAANPSQTHKGPTLYYHDVNTVTGAYELNDRPASDPGSAGVKNFEHIQEINQLATEGLIWGAGMGSTEMVFHRETAQTQMDEYVGFQWADFAQSMWLLECIKHRVKTYIHGSRQNKRGHKKPRDTWRATIYTPDFMPGDVVDMHSYVFDVQDNVPVREMKITFINPTEAQFELTLSHHMDTAYTTSMWWDPDDPDGPPDGPPPDGGGPGTKWYNQTIPIGVGPIITPGPFNPPPDSNYDCSPGPDAVLVDKIRTWSDGTVQRLGAGFHPFDGNVYFGAYLERLGNHAWYNCVCPAIIGLGCWAGRAVMVQYWYQITIPAGFNNTLYVLGQRVTYEGSPGDYGASMVTDQDTYDTWHEEVERADKLIVPGQPATGGSIGGDGDYVNPNGWYGGTYPSPGATPIKVGDQDVLPGHLPPLQEGECAKYHWYSGCWGGYSYIPTFALSNPPADQNIWLVFTPGWEVAEVIKRVPSDGYCDTSYTTGIAAGQGPRAEGHGGSGGYDLPLTLETIHCGGGGGSYDGSLPLPTDDTGVGYYQGPADKTYYTHFPYVPGSLSVFFNGVPYHQFVEMDPATGQFSVHIGGQYSYGAFDIRYMASSPDPTDHGGMGEYNEETPAKELLPDPGGPEGGPVMRPKFISAFGWGTEFDGANVPFAAMSMFMERTTQGSMIKTPEQNRNAANFGSHSQVLPFKLRDVAKYWEVGYWYPYEHSWENFKSAINEGRGVVIIGNPATLGAFRPKTGVGTFTGPHALYINEIRASDGWFLVYDSFWRTTDDGVRYVSPGVIRDYAASFSGADGVVRQPLYTYRTQRV